MSAQANSVANTMLSQAITSLGLIQVAWAGAYGKEHYRMTSAYDADLAALASWAHNANELLHLATGWRRAQNSASEDDYLHPLTVVVDDFPPRLWESLSQLQRQGLSLLVILMDEQHKYVAAGSSAGGLNGYAQALGIYCSEPVECCLLSTISSCLNKCLEHKGVCLAHLVGPSPAPMPETPLIPDFNWQSFPPGPYNYSAKELPSLEAAALVRFLPELMQDTQTVALWTRSLHPGPLLKLGRRLQYCAVNGLVWQIAGLVKQNFHPVVFLSAVQIPLLLPELMGLEGCPVTFVILDGCCSYYTGSGKRQPLAKLHDFALLRTIPDMILAEPADEEEARAIMAALLRLQGLSALRLMTVPALNIPPAPEAKPLTIGQGRRLRQGRNLSFICLGPQVNIALLANETLRSWGLQAGVYDMRFLRPLDTDLLKDAAAAQRIVTVEDHSAVGGLGSAVSECLIDTGLVNQLHQFIKVGLDRDFLECAPEDHGICINSLLEAAKQALELT